MKPGKLALLAALSEPWDADSVGRERCGGSVTLAWRLGFGESSLRELETLLQQFGEFLLRARLVKEKAAPHCVRRVRRFLIRPASNDPLAGSSV